MKESAENKRLVLSKVRSKDTPKALARNITEIFSAVLPEMQA